MWLNFEQKRLFCKCNWIQCSDSGALANVVLLMWLSRGRQVLCLIHSLYKLTIRVTLCWNTSQHWKREGDVTSFICCYRDGNIWLSDNEQLGEVQLYIAQLFASQAWVRVFSLVLCYHLMASLEVHFTFLLEFFLGSLLLTGASLTFIIRVV